VGFDLDTIRQVLDSELAPDAAVKMRCDALEAEQRVLSRRRLILRAATRGDRKDVLDRLREKQALARLDRLEREAFLQRHWGRAPHGKSSDRCRTIPLTRVRSTGWRAHCVPECR